MRAVTYSRVSTEDQGTNGVSLAHQSEKCKLQAQLADMEIIGEIVDSGKSAKNLNRPGIQQILEMVKRKEIQAVIVYKLDRLTRSVSDLNNLIQTFLKHDVALVSVKDSLDTKTASGRMIINLLGTISQWERESIAERTKDALGFKKSTGKKYTGITPYGFTLEGSDYVEDAKEQETIREIVRLRDEAGMSFQAIADYLNAVGVPTRKGNPWIKTSTCTIYNSTKAGKRMKVAA
jgi:site-specific DNA recombinase